MGRAATRKRFPVFPAIVAPVGLALAVIALSAGPLSGQAKTGQSKKGDQPAPAKPLRSVASFAGIIDPEARSAALFLEASKVFLHPRCTNCHSASKRPRRGDKQSAHRPRVSGGKDGTGTSAMRCATCHSPSGVIRPGAPIVEGWRLAPVSAGWRKKSPREVCLQVRDENRNGGMDLATLQKHLATDRLIAWSWNPGAKLTPAPGPKGVFLNLMKAWAETGAHCPE